MRHGFALRHPIQASSSERDTGSSAIFSSLRADLSPEALAKREGEAIHFIFSGLRRRFTPRNDHSHSSNAVVAHRKFAFTLIELSIVLVIIGLVLGGVLVGQDLIRATGNRKVISEVQTIQTSISAFKLKYNCLPGDCPNATQFFGTDPAGCPAPYKTAVGSNTCNGNGNGTIGTQNTTENQETFRAMQQLNLAGFSNQTLTGTPYSTQGGTEVGLNTPPSKAYPKNGYLLQNQQTMTNASYCTAYGGGCWYWQGMPRNHVIYMNTSGQQQGHEGWAEGVKGLDALNIDTKIDDSKPQSGKMTTLLYSQGCMTTTDEATAAYSTTSTTDCHSLIFATDY